LDKALRQYHRIENALTDSFLALPLKRAMIGLISTRCVNGVIWHLVRGQKIGLKSCEKCYILALHISATLRKRGILEIIGSMLECLEGGGLKKTHLTYRAGIDNRTAGKYVSFLIECKFIEKSKKEDSLFVMTERGRDFLKIYQNLLQTFGAAETLGFNIKVSSLQA
jgi:predicted transcriptional regulator